MIEPAQMSLTIRRNATFDPIFLWKDEDGDAIDLTGCTVELTVKDSANTRAAKLHLISSNTDGMLVVDPTAGRISANVPPTHLTKLKASALVFDLRVSFPNGYVAVIAEGSANVIAGVTE